MVFPFFLKCDIHLPDTQDTRRRNMQANSHEDSALPATTGKLRLQQKACSTRDGVRPVKSPICTASQSPLPKYWLRLGQPSVQILNYFLASYRFKVDFRR